VPKSERENEKNVYFEINPGSQSGSGIRLGRKGAVNLGYYKRE
jgi:hypothetical protein